MANLTIKAREILSRVRPDSVGHAARSSGIKPTDIASQLIHRNILQRQKKGAARNRKF